jgi:hypothetical protein
MSLDAIRARLARDGAYYIDASILEDLEKGRACDYGQRTAAKMLRERGDWIVHAESEIERLRGETDEFFKTIQELREKCAQLTVERDEARRLACKGLSDEAYQVMRKIGPSIWKKDSLTPSEMATERGWDCFKESSDDR